MTRRALALLLAILSLLTLTFCKDEKKEKADMFKTDPSEGYFEEALFGFSEEQVCSNPARGYGETDTEGVICAPEVTDCSLVGNRKCNIFYTFVDGKLTEVTVYVTPNSGESNQDAAAAIEKILSGHYGKSISIGSASAVRRYYSWTTENSRVTLSGTNEGVTLHYVQPNADNDGNITIG